VVFFSDLFMDDELVVIDLMEVMYFYFIDWDHWDY
jgi:hypothetical protein